MTEPHSCSFILEPPDLRQRIIRSRGADRDSIQVAVFERALPDLLVTFGLHKDGEEWFMKDRYLTNVDQFAHGELVGFRCDELTRGHDSNGSPVTSAARWILLSDRKRTVRIEGPPAHPALLRSIEGSVKLLP
jgi:hypothetical protein